MDSYALSTLSKQEYLSWLLKELGGNPTGKSEQEVYELCKDRLEKLVQKFDRVVIIFNRFDQLAPEFDKLFLANIRSFRHINSEKIVMIFTANKPLYEIASEAIIGTNLNFYSQILYFGRYSKADQIQLLEINTPDTPIHHQDIQRLIKLSGGHNQLLMIMLKSETPRF